MMNSSTNANSSSRRTVTMPPEQQAFLDSVAQDSIRQWKEGPRYDSLAAEDIDFDFRPHRGNFGSGAREGGVGNFNDSMMELSSFLFSLVDGRGSNSMTSSSRGGRQRKGRRSRGGNVQLGAGGSSSGGLGGSLIHDMEALHNLSLTREEQERLYFGVVHQKAQGNHPPLTGDDTTTASETCSDSVLQQQNKPQGQPDQQLEENRHQAAAVDDREVSQSHPLGATDTRACGDESSSKKSIDGGLEVGLEQDPLSYEFKNETIEKMYQIHNKIGQGSYLITSVVLMICACCFGVIITSHEVWTVNVAGVIHFVLMIVLSVAAFINYTQAYLPNLDTKIKASLEEKHRRVKISENCGVVLLVFAIWPVLECYHSVPFCLDRVQRPPYSWLPDMAHHYCARGLPIFIGALFGFPLYFINVPWKRVVPLQCSLSLAFFFSRLTARFFRTDDNFDTLEENLLKSFLILVCSVISSFAVYMTDRATRARFKTWVLGQRALRMYQKRRAILDSSMRALLSESSLKKLMSNQPVVDISQNCAVSVCQVCDFASWSCSVLPSVVVSTIDALFVTFDVGVSSFGLGKVRTVGDRYVTSQNLEEGGSVMVLDTSPIVHFGLWQLQVGLHLASLLQDQDGSSPTSSQLAVQVGIHSGPAFGGIVGTQSLWYEVFGEAINGALELVAIAEPSCVLVSESTRVQYGDTFIEDEFTSATDVSSGGGRRDLPKRNSGNGENFSALNRSGDGLGSSNPSSSIHPSHVIVGVIKQFRPATPTTKATGSTIPEPSTVLSSPVSPRLSNLVASSTATATNSPLNGSIATDFTSNSGGSATELDEARRRFLEKRLKRTLHKDIGMEEATSYKDEILKVSRKFQKTETNLLKIRFVDDLETSYHDYLKLAVQTFGLTSHLAFVACTITLMIVTAIEGTCTWWSFFFFDLAVAVQIFLIETCIRGGGAKKLSDKQHGLVQVGCVLALYAGCFFTKPSVVNGKVIYLHTWGTYMTNYVNQRLSWRTRSALVGLITIAQHFASQITSHGAPATSVTITIVGGFAACVFSSFANEIRNRYHFRDTKIAMVSAEATRSVSVLQRTMLLMLVPRFAINRVITKSRALDQANADPTSTQYAEEINPTVMLDSTSYMSLLTVEVVNFAQLLHTTPLTHVRTLLNKVEAMHHSIETAIAECGFEAVRKIHAVGDTVVIGGPFLEKKARHRVSRRQSEVVNDDFRTALKATPTPEGDTQAVGGAVEEEEPALKNLSFDPAVATRAFPVKYDETGEAAAAILNIALQLRRVHGSNLSATLACGSAIMAVLGKERPTLDLLGPLTRTTFALQQAAPPGFVGMSRSFMQLLKDSHISLPRTHLGAGQDFTIGEMQRWRMRGAGVVWVYPLHPPQSPAGDSVDSRQ